MSAECTPSVYQQLMTHREEVLGIARRHGAQNVRVFGSVVRHEADEHSDTVTFDLDLVWGAVVRDLPNLRSQLERLLPEL